MYIVLKNTEIIIESEVLLMFKHEKQLFHPVEVEKPNP